MSSRIDVYIKDSLPQWIPEEVAQIKALAEGIANCRLPRRRAARQSRLDLRLSDGMGLLLGLAGSSRALLVRQLLRELGFDENRHVQWRLEHKLVQAMVLHQWVPEWIPVSCGLDTLVRL